MAEEATARESRGFVASLRSAASYITLDIVFRAILGFAFVMMIVLALDMPESPFGDPAAYPMFVGIIGLSLWVISNVHEAMRLFGGKQQGRIYDITFETDGLSKTVVWLRTAWVFAILGFTILAVWLVNFHIAIPGFLALYLRFVGKTQWWVAISLAILIEIPIVVLYGAVIHTAWPDSVIERVFDFSIQNFLDGPLA